MMFYIWIDVRRKMNPAGFMNKLALNAIMYLLRVVHWFASLLFLLPSVYLSFCLTSV